MTGRKRWVIKKGVKTTGDEVERKIKKETKNDNIRRAEKKKKKRRGKDESTKQRKEY